MKALIRLSKRMSELDLCSRREAEKLIAQGNVLVKGKKVDCTNLGVKVSPNEVDISLLINNYNNRNNKLTNKFEDWNYFRGDTIILNKPIGYVSGQPDPTTNYTPAIRLITPENFCCRNVVRRHRRNGSTSSSFTTNTRDLEDDLKTTVRKYMTFGGRSDTIQGGFVPAGRLDINSSGLIIMTKCGVVAKHLITIPSSNNKNNDNDKRIVEKEYIVKVDTSFSSSAAANNDGYNNKRDLDILLRGGIKLKGECHKPPLLPLIEAHWLNESQIKMVLQEGRKRQIRRICEELLNVKVVALKRTRIDNILLSGLPIGKWRPLLEYEVRSLIGQLH